MNHKRFFTQGTTLVMLVLVFAGCASSQAADSCPTTAPLACPSAVAQACPNCNSASGFVPMDDNIWFNKESPTADFTVTVDPGEKCTMKGVSSHIKGMIEYNFIINDQAHETYALIMLTLDEGKTLADLEAYANVTSPPPWSTPVQYDFETPGSYSHHTANISEGPLYFVCFYVDNIPVIIGTFGPLEITE